MEDEEYLTTLSANPGAGASADLGTIRRVASSVIITADTACLGQFAKGNPALGSPGTFVIPPNTALRIPVHFPQDTDLSITNTGAAAARISVIVLRPRTQTVYGNENG